MTVRKDNAFTLIELLVVIAVIAILAALLMPALAGAKEKGRQVVCLNNLKQLQVAYQMYYEDYNNRLPLNDVDGNGAWSASLTNSWIIGNARASADPDFIKKGTLFHYARGIGVYHCPADQSKVYQTSDLRLRSYSLNAYLNGMQNSVKSAAQIKSPSEAFSFLDENEVSIDDGFFLITRAPQNVWINLASDRHSRGANLAFLDGHCTLFKWRTSKTWTGGNQVATGADLDDLRMLQAVLPNLP